jgi:Skp family chaperone for outer membrane proteins
MKVCFVAAALAVLAAAPSYAQSASASQASAGETQTTAQPPAAQPPATQPPAAPKPTTPAPATQPPAAPATPPAPPRPFPEGAKIAYINAQFIASNSAEGKASSAKISQLTQKKTNEINEKNKALTTAQQKLQSGSLLNEAARAQLEKEVEKINVELQRLQQDAQAELQDLQRDLQQEFEKKLMPVIQQVAQEKGIQILLSVTDSGVIWADTGLDLSAEVIKRLDAGATKAPAKQP